MHGSFKMQISSGPVFQREQLWSFVSAVLAVAIFRTIAQHHARLVRGWTLFDAAARAHLLLRTLRTQLRIKDGRVRHVRSHRISVIAFKCFPSERFLWISALLVFSAVHPTPWTS